MLRKLKTSQELLFHKKFYIILLAVSCIISFVISYTMIKGVTASNDMYPTFTEGQKLIAVRSSSYTYGDIVAYESPIEDSDAYIIRRVLGLPGDTVLFQNETIYINGEAIVEDYAYYDKNKEGYHEGVPFTLEENEYFLVGDNRNYCIDSRVLGPISGDLIFGKISAD